MQAGAITMLTVRLGPVISPADWRFIAGDRRRSLELRAGGGGHVYYLATVVKPSGVATATAAARASAENHAGFVFLLASPLVGGIALLGGLLTMASAVRVLYPALADNWQMSAAQIGFLYARSCRCGYWRVNQWEAGT